MRSTGVPVLARIPETRNGLSACSPCGNDTEPVGHDDSVADLVSQPRGDVSAQNRVEQSSNSLPAAKVKALTAANLYCLK